MLPEMVYFANPANFIGMFLDPRSRTTWLATSSRNFLISLVLTKYPHFWIGNNRMGPSSEKQGRGLTLTCRGEEIHAVR